MKKNSFKVAFTGVISALGVALMFLTGVIPFGTYALPALAGMLLIPVVIEYGRTVGLAVYFGVSVLSVLLAADKEAVMFYIIFLGYYPLLKSLIESKLHKKALRYVLKLLVFNAAMVSSFYIGKYLLSIPDDSFVIFGVYLPYVFLILANLFFVIYDICLTGLVVQYVNRLHKKLFK